MIIWNIVFLVLGFIIGYMKCEFDYLRGDNND